MGLVPFLRVRLAVTLYRTRWATSLLSLPSPLGLRVLQCGKLSFPALIFINSNYQDVSVSGWGGKRRGAGRKAGGGIPAAKSLRTEARALLAEIVGTDRDPLMVAINIAADITKPDALRLEAALGASRYLHPTLSASAVAHLPQMSDANTVVATLLNRLAKLAPANPLLEARIEPQEIAA